MNKLSFIFIGSILILFFAGCTLLEDAGLWKRPQVKVSALKINSLDFEKININVELDVLNPNPYGVSVGMLDYSFKIHNNEIFSGKQKDSMNLEPQKSNKIVFPVTLFYDKIFTAVSESRDKDIIKYVFSGGLNLNAPGGGSIRIPFSASNDIPVPKIPKIKVESLKIEQINMFSAAMKLKIRVQNPNTFKVNLKNYNYIFELNNAQVGSGKSDSGISIDSGKEKLIEFPVNVSFSKAGLALYKILTSNTSPNYLFKLEGEAGTGLDFFDSFPLKTEKKGKINLIR